MRDSTPFSLRSALFPELPVVRFRGEEHVNDLYRFEALVALERGSSDAIENLVGAPVELSMLGGNGRRRPFYGIVSKVDHDEHHERRGKRARVRIVPRAHLLRKRRNSRVFSDKRCDEIVSLLLDEHGIAHQWSLTRQCPVREYTVQYQETDFAFISRLLAERGIFYFFEHSPDFVGFVEKGTADWSLESMRLADGTHALDPIGADPALLYRPIDRSDALRADENTIFRFAQIRSLRQNTFYVRDYDFRRPQLDLVARAEVEEGERAPGPLVRFEHHGEYDEPEVDGVFAAVGLEQLRVGESAAEGASHALRLAAGSVFQLLEHPAFESVDGYVLTTVVHEATSPDGAPVDSTYECRFRCLPGGVAPRPPRPQRRIQQVCEVAIVVGAAGQEIDTDEHGRVRVQFLWDKIGQRDEHSSCWLRVALPWSGPNWGFQFVPRIGCEVLVSFIGGDVDRPIVIGCLPGTATPTPFPLPLSKTRSGIRTQSTPDAGGYNEIAFDDAKGAEQLVLHAHRRLDQSVGDERTAQIGANDSLGVVGSRSVSVGKNLDDQVGGFRKVTTGADVVQLVHGGQTELIDKDYMRELGGASNVTINGSSTETIAKDHTLFVNGSSRTTIGRGDSEASVIVNGDYNVAATKRLAIVGDKSIRLTSGASSIELTPEGIYIRTPKIRFKVVKDCVIAAKTMKATTEVTQIDASSVIALFSGGQDEGGFVSAPSSIMMGLGLPGSSAIHMDSPYIGLNCLQPIKAVRILDDQPPPPLKSLNVRARTAAGGLANQPYRLAVEGVTVQGVTGADGSISVQVPEGAKTATLTVGGGTSARDFALTLAPLPPTSSPRGAQMRLQNLGYLSGDPAEEWNEEALAALLEFQRDHALPLTRAVDAATSALLREKAS